MANPTTNFGWVMPTSTDLVTDLPADFAIFGQAVDTSMADLKGGTTGQVLSKATNADMDFTWVAQDDSNAIQNAIVDAKGDLITATAADTPARLAVGTNGQTLVADSSTATGLKWATPSSGGKVLQVVSATTSTQVNLTTATYTDTNITATITPTSATSKILVMVTAQCRTAGSGATISYTEGNAKLVRGATDVFLMNNTNFFSVYIDGAAEAGIRHTFAFNYLDSPATTSATTYKVQANNAVGNLFFQVNSNTSQIILMEIGA